MLSLSPPLLLWGEYIEQERPPQPKKPPATVLPHMVYSYAIIMAGLGSKLAMCITLEGSHMVKALDYGVRGCEFESRQLNSFSPESLVPCTPQEKA